MLYPHTIPLQWVYRSAMGVAVTIAVLVLAVPLGLAFANARGWLPDRFWRAANLERVMWLEQRPWVASILSAGFFGVFVVLELRDGDTSGALFTLLWGAFWSAMPYWTVQERRRQREDYRRAVGQSAPAKAPE